MTKRKMSGIGREKLMARLEYLQGLLNGSAYRLKEGAENYADPLDRATAEHERAVELTIRHRDSEEIKEIQEALRRIEKGQFGICTHCGSAISPKRLLLAPMSRLCIPCKEEIEREQHQQGRWPTGRVAYGER